MFGISALKWRWGSGSRIWTWLLTWPRSHKRNPASSLTPDSAITPTVRSSVGLGVMWRCKITTLSGKVCFMWHFYALLGWLRKSFLERFPFGYNTHSNVQLIPFLRTTSCPASSPSSSLRVVWRGFSGAGVGGWHELLPHFTGQADTPPCQHHHARVLAPQHQCVNVWSQPGCGGTPPPPTWRHTRPFTHPHTHSEGICMRWHSSPLQGWIQETLTDCFTC